MIEQLGGKATPAVGFAMGVERLIELIKDQNKQLSQNVPDIYFISVGQTSRLTALKIAQNLRQVGKIVQLHCGEGSLKNQIKRADKSGATVALILGEDEINNEQIIIKPLLSRNEQQSIAQSELLTSLDTLLKV